MTFPVSPPHWDGAAYSLGHLQCSETAVLPQKVFKVFSLVGGWHEQGLISNERCAITLLDRQGLEKLTCEGHRKVRDGFDRLFAGK